MDFEDVLAPQWGIAAAVLALAVAPPVRQAARRAAVLGLAGVLAAGDLLGALARRAGGAPQPPGEDALTGQLAEEARAERARGPRLSGTAHGPQGHATA